MMIFISVTTSFIFLAIGVLFGWVAAEVKQEHMYNAQEEQSVHPEMLNAHGKSNRPDQPMNTNRSRFNQSSRTSNQPSEFVGARKVDATINFSYEKSTRRCFV